MIRIVFGIICGIAALSGLLLVVFQHTNFCQKIIIFLKKHHLASALYLTMIIIGLLSAILSR